MKRYPRVTVPHHDSDGLSLRLTFCKFNVDCQWELKVDRTGLSEMKRYPRVTVPHHDSDGPSLRLTFCKFNVDCQWELKVDGSVLNEEVSQSDCSSP